MQFSKLFLAVLSFVALAAALPMHADVSGSLARRTSDIAARSPSTSLDESNSLLARAFGEDDDTYLQRRDNCIVCLEADAKHTNCPSGALHPAHVQCLIDWANDQFTAGRPMTCPGCRANVSPLIKVVKKGNGKGKRDLEELELDLDTRDFDEFEAELDRRDFDDFETELDMRDFEEETESDIIMRTFEEDEELAPASGLMRRDDQCAICLEANAKHSNCPNGASHPAHIQCLIAWAQAQTNAGHPLTCAACRAQVGGLIKKVKH